MEIEGRETIVLELKYCERCGGLWLRRFNSELVYCGDCATAVTDMAVPRRRPTHARLPEGRGSGHEPRRLYLVHGEGCPA